MDDYLKEAIEIAKAQASIRTMRVDEITTFVQKVSEGLRKTAEGVFPVSEQKDQATSVVEGKKSIKEKTVTCLVGTFTKAGGASMLWITDLFLMGISSGRTGIGKQTGGA